MQPPSAAPQPYLIVPTPIPDLMDADDSELPAPSIPLPQAVAPPRPPNPELIALHARLYEKFTTELASLTGSVAQENERLRGAQADLLKGEPAVRDEMARLEAVRDVCQTVRDQLGEVVNAAENAIAGLERKGEPEVDELICATNIVHNQCARIFFYWRLKKRTYSFVVCTDWLTLSPKTTRSRIRFTISIERSTQVNWTWTSSSRYSRLAHPISVSFSLTLPLRRPPDSWPRSSS
jgi:hypothetical protein